MKTDDAKASGREFQFPVHFVCSQKAIWPELRDERRVSVIDGSRLAELSANHVDCWIDRTCHELRQKFVNISIGPEIRANAINFVHTFDLRSKLRLSFNFIVTLQGDGYRSALSNFNVRQNGLEAASDTQSWVPHWPQPGLIARNIDRGSDISTVAFRGSQINLVEGMRKPAFARKLAELGCRFDQGLEQIGSRVVWEDYSEVDVFVALRNVTVGDLHNKPASKLVNAWTAGVPAILGPEPAFQELRRSELDYIEASTADDVIAAVAALKADPARYLRMVENGRERARDFTPDRVRDAWAAMIDGPITQAYRTWHSKSRLLRVPAILAMLWDEPRRRQVYLNYRDHGFRPLGNPDGGSN